MTLAVPPVRDHGRSTKLDVLLAVLGPPEGLDVVDVGCGDGAIARALAERGARVVGVDPFMDAAGEERAGQGAWRRVRAPAGATGLPEASADAVLFVFSLHHVPAAEMAAALDEARRLLRPDGRLVVAEPLAEGPNFEACRPFHDETEVRAAAQAAIRDHALPRFREAEVHGFAEARAYDGFEAFAARMAANARFNPYTEDEVRDPAVRRNFEDVVARHGTVFEQPVRVDVLAGPA
jgi:ubiquinone/menaquinone biosynthesis C-methylase UbiE